MVGIESRTIRGIGSGKGRHRNTMSISLPLKQMIKIGIFEHPQHHARADTLRVATNQDSQLW